MRSPGRRKRFTTNNQLAKLGSTRMFLPAIWMKNPEWPMKVTPRSPLDVRTGLCQLPERRVKTEWRTILTSWRALRRREVFSMDQMIRRGREVEGANLVAAVSSFKFRV